MAYEERSTQELIEAYSSIVARYVGYELAALDPEPMELFGVKNQVVDSFLDFVRQVRKEAFDEGANACMESTWGTGSPIVTNPHEKE